MQFTMQMRFLLASFLLCALCLDAEDAKPAFVVVEGDALDQAGDVFGQRLALGCCGTHPVGALFTHG